MAKLNHDESLALIRVFVRGQNSLKGCALDCARMALPITENDRQFKAMEKMVKDRESSIRGIFLQALVDAGVCEPLTNPEIFELK